LKSAFAPYRLLQEFVWNGSHSCNTL